MVIIVVAHARTSAEKAVSVILDRPWSWFSEAPTEEAFRRLFGARV
jgi:hypothetical protein